MFVPVRLRPVDALGHGVELVGHNSSALMLAPANQILARIINRLVANRATQDLLPAIITDNLARRVQSLGNVVQLRFDARQVGACLRRLECQLLQLRSGFVAGLLCLCVAGQTP